MSPTSEKTELRICLVLYGGVSLAVYENGVTRALFDLVKRRGGFAPLLDLLDMSAVVDVIAGTSAGGINGLMLAAALEHDSAFEQTAELWREHGDLGKLLRADPKDAPSLLDSEGYYQERLYEAFLNLVGHQKDKQSQTSAWEHEIDVLITGTDLDGSLLQHQDALGNEIQDKSHRVVFRLKHRPGRHWLGLPDPLTRLTSEEDRKLQAAVLASVARITSTFPVAFAPFHASQLDRLGRLQGPNQLSSDSGRRVGPILGYLGNIDGDEQLVDGGVLDNKPFGPALNAVFYRMPKGRVQRRLYYLEPDPAEYSTRNSHTNHTPARVALAALTSIPGYEGISEDLERIRHHNSQVRWLKTLRHEILDQLARESNQQTLESSSLQWRIYCDARAASLAKSMLLKWERVPSARDYPRTATSKSLLQNVTRELLDLARLEDPPLTGLDPWDVEFQLRRCFFLLYHHYESMFGCSEEERSPESETSPTDYLTALQAMGRLVKFLEIVRAALMHYRNHHVIGYESSLRGKEQLMLRYACLMDSNEPSWSPIDSQLQDAIDEDIRILADDVDGPLSKQRLTDALSTALERLKPPSLVELENRSAIPEDSILATVQDATKAVVERLYPNRFVFDSFALVDLYSFPAEYSTGIHELDELEYVRISPKDAKAGLSGLVAEQEKVCGDELAHFAAFLRMDWRSNDILWGQIDGISQIVSDLLRDDVLMDLAERNTAVPSCLSEDSLAKALEGCPQKQIDDLVDLAKEIFVGHQPPKEKCLEFRNALASALQYIAVAREVPSVFRDVHLQDMEWDLAERQGIKSISSKGLQELSAEEHTQEILENLPPETRWEKFRNIALGKERIAGSHGRVPLNILGEYISRSYELIWGLLDQSLRGEEKERDSVLSRSRVKTIGLRPIQALRVVLALSRTEQAIAPLVFVAILALTFTGLLLAVYEGKTLAAFLFAMAFLVSSLVISFLTPGVAWKHRRWRLVLASVISAIVLVTMVTLSILVVPHALNHPEMVAAKAKSLNLWLAGLGVVFAAGILLLASFLFYRRMNQKTTSSKL